MRLQLTAISILLLSVIQLHAATFLGSYNLHDYYLSDQEISLSDGRIAANALGTSLNRRSYLAAITSQAEQDALVGMLELRPTFPEVRIGLSDEVQEGTFIWDSGEPFAFTYWNPGEPNDNPSPYGGEDSVVFNQFFSSRWNDLGSPALRTALIEVAEFVPEPSASLLVIPGLFILLGYRSHRRAYV